ncbi:MAG: hypothetical protein AAF840_16445, partial [Bacteroidota bacterium]
RHRNWSFSLGWRIHTGSRYTEQGENVFILVPDSPRRVLRSILPPYNGETLPAYHRLDLSAFYDFGSTKNRSLKGQLGLSLLNLYGHQNILERRYLVRRRTQAGIIAKVDELNQLGLGLTPNLQLRLAFK